MSELFSATGTILMTIPSGAAVSNTIDISQTLYDAEALVVKAPAVLDSLTYTWEASNDGGVSYGTFQDATATVVKVPGATFIMIFNGVFTAITNLRIAASGNAEADRVFKVSKSFRAGQ